MVPIVACGGRGVRHFTGQLMGGFESPYRRRLFVTSRPLG